MLLQTFQEFQNSRTLTTTKHWKKVVESVRDNYEVPDKMLISIVNIRLAGSIVKKFNTRKFETAKEMWDSMDEEFGHGKETDQNDDLDVLNHPPASVKDIRGYIQHFEEYLSRLNGLFVSEKQQVALFTLPLSQVIVNSMASQDLQTLAAAKRAATGLGKMVVTDIFGENVRAVQLAKNKQRGNNINKSSNQPTKNNDTVVCYYCDKPGHYASECRSKQNKDQRSNKSNRSFNRRNNRNMNGKSLRSIPSSFYDIKDSKN